MKNRSNKNRLTKFEAQMETEYLKLAHIGDSIVAYIMRLNQTIADQRKHIKSQEANFKTIIKQKEETIRQLNRIIQRNNRDIETMKNGSAKDFPDPNKKSNVFTLGESVKIRKKS